MKFKDFCNILKDKIKTAYTEIILTQDAEKLAGEFLFAQLETSGQISRADLDARMRKSGLKAVRAAVYAEICSKAEKKPTESQLEHALNSHELVNSEQNELDKAEVERDELLRLFGIFNSSHVYYRQIGRGNNG